MMFIKVTLAVISIFTIPVIIIYLISFIKDYLNFFNLETGVKMKFKDVKALVDVLPEEDIDLYTNGILIHGINYNRITVNLSFLGYIQYLIYLKQCEKRATKKAQKDELLKLIDLLEYTSKQLTTEKEKADKEVESAVENLKRFYEK